ncbi:MAG TPA: lysylphosphatidylglycerol synthase domain-containing protein [Stellaceae bacterium]|nr:lysylphosphatidylglycerol synthase domain-containing protein [Stellaceae bacterium]
MKRLAVLAFIAGIGVITVLVFSRGAGAVWHALTAIGWSGFAIVCLFHLALIGLMGISWLVLVPETRGARALTLIWARLVRDSGAEILPFSQLGGFVMGARAAAVSGVPSLVAAASTVVDVTVELFAQIAFTAVGLAFLVAARPDSGLAWPIGGALCVMLAASIGFVIAQRRGLSIADRIASHMLGDWVKTGLSLAGIESVIAAIYHRQGRAWLGGALHFLCWIASGVEAWIALRLMGAEIGLGPVIAIESLLYAARSVAFAVPSAVGVQEGAYLVIGGLFGLAPETVLALSLLKRARDLTLGVPALLAWQALEARRAMARAPASGSAVP